jgi:hypothetical protein
LNICSKEGGDGRGYKAVVRYSHLWNTISNTLSNGDQTASGSRYWRNNFVFRLGGWSWGVAVVAVVAVIAVVTVVAVVHVIAVATVVTVVVRKQGLPLVL